jgi:hypothetical protein
MPLFKTEEQEGKTVPVYGLVWAGGGRIKERGEGGWM